MRSATIARPQNGEADLEAKAQAIVIRFLETLPELRRTIAEDVQAAFDGDPAAESPDEIVFCYPGIVGRDRLSPGSRALSPGRPADPPDDDRIRPRQDRHRHPSRRHDRSAVLHRPWHRRRDRRDDQIGEGVKLYQGVTLGALSFPRDEKTGQIVRDAKRHPTIEDGVVIYANATILGGETVIGHHSVIGSSAWITRSIAPYTMVTIEEPAAPLSRIERRSSRFRVFQAAQLPDLNW